MKTINVLFDSRLLAETAFNDLTDRGLGEFRMNIVAAATKDEVYRDLSLGFKTPMITIATILGAIIGGVALLLTFIHFEPSTFVMGGGAIWAGIAAGAILGAICGTIIEWWQTKPQNKQELLAIAEAVAKGGVLLSINVPDEDAWWVAKIIERYKIFGPAYFYKKSLAQKRRNIGWQRRFNA